MGTPAGSETRTMSSLSLATCSLPDVAATNCSAGLLRLLELLQTVLPMYLIDGQQPLLCAESWAVLAHSPNMARYKLFARDATTAPRHFMPPFELDEVMQLLPWVLPSREQLTAHEVRSGTAPSQVGGWAKPCSIIKQMLQTCGQPQAE